MKYFLCRGTSILASLSVFEVELEVFDIDAAHIAAYGYRVIAIEDDEFTEAIIQDGSIRWVPTLPVALPLTPLEKFDAEVAASFA